MCCTKRAYRQCTHQIRLRIHSSILWCHLEIFESLTHSFSTTLYLTRSIHFWRSRNSRCTIKGCNLTFQVKGWFLFVQWAQEKVSPNFFLSWWHVCTVCTQQARKIKKCKKITQKHLSLPHSNFCHKMSLIRKHKNVSCFYKVTFWTICRPYVHPCDQNHVKSHGN